MNLLVVLPLREEIEFLVRCLEGQGFVGEVEVVGRVRVQRFAELGITVAHGGHGKAQCAVQTQYLLDVGVSFDGVICMGAAGALSPLVTVGDVVIGNKTVEHDYNLRFVRRPLPQFAGSPQLLAYLQPKVSVVNAFKVHYGVIASGDEDIVTVERGEELMRSTDGLAVAWEGAGVARACVFSGVPFVEMRGITDTADHTAPGDFEANLEVAMTNLGMFLVQCVQKVEGWTKV